MNDYLKCKWLKTIFWKLSWIYPGSLKYRLHGNIGESNNNLSYVAQEKQDQCAHSGLYMYVMNNVRKAVIISIFVVTFMQGIYNYIPETNHVSKAYGVAAVL
jgi:hypothetical protein